MAHAPGPAEKVPLLQPLTHLTRLMSRTELPRSVTVVTFNNRTGAGYGGKKLGLLEAGLEAVGVPYTVLGGDVGKWPGNLIKIRLLDEYAASAGTEYLLMADSTDVFVTNRLEGLVERFLGLGCDAIFNAEKDMSPKGLTEDFYAFENSVHKGLYLNSGLWMARTSFVRELTAFMRGLPKTHKADQLYFKLAYRNFHPRMIVDVRCELFQGLRLFGPEELSLLKVY